MTVARSRPAACPPCCPAAVPSPTPTARVDAATAWGVDHLPETEGRDTDGILAALTAGEVGGLVIGGVDPDDLADPAAARAAIDAAGFVVSLELRATDVTRAADVVFPVAPVTDKAGTFVTWEGRPRPFDAVLSSPASLPDLRILAGIAEESGTSLGFRTVADVRTLMEEFGPWDGERATAPAAAERSGRERKLATGTFWLSSWKQMLDDGSMQDGAEALREPPPARRSPASRSRRTPRWVPRRSPSRATVARSPCRSRPRTSPMTPCGCRRTATATSSRPWPRRAPR